MQYLAELRKASGLISNKVEIRLLARNASPAENNWQAITSEETLTVADGNQAKDFKDGQLVMAEVSASRQVQSLQDASRRIVMLLQNFSRLQDKYKQGEEDIEQWKQSLNFQSQELHRREMELEQREQELENIDIRRQELEALQEEFRREREAFDRLKHELEAKHQVISAQASTLSLEQVQSLQQLTEELAACLSDPAAMQQHLSAGLEVLYQRQEVLTGFWNELEGLRKQAQQIQGSLGGSMQELAGRKQQWLQVQAALAEAQAELKAQHSVLKLQENNASLLRTQIERLEELAQQTAQVIESYGGATETLTDEEIERLESMPLPELERSLADWQAEFDKLSNYVSAQEDELAALEGEIADLQSQIDTVNEFERIELESNKEFAEEQYRMLEEALVGQRRTLRERQAILLQQRTILERRQGAEIPENPVQAVVPLLQQIDAYKQQQLQELRKMETQIETVKGIAHKQQELVERQNQEHQQGLRELQAIENQIYERIRTAAELGGRVVALEGVLRPVQDIIDCVRPALEAALRTVGDMRSTEEQQRILSTLRHTLAGLVPQMV